MAVTFVLGRAGTGKTRGCLDAIRAELAHDDDSRRLLLLVPEQAGLQMERALALSAPRGGYWRAEVLSFSRLAHRVFAQTGTAPTIVGTPTRGLALRRLVASRRAELRVWRRLSRTAGFYAELERLIEELIREEVAPADLRAAADQVPDDDATLRDLARVYDDYVAWLGPGRIDAGALAAAIRERMDRLPWLADASIWVDGFAGFTGAELHTLVELARRARDVTITLLLDPASPIVADPHRTPDSLGLFQRTELTYQRLVRSFAEANVTIKPPTRLAPPVVPRFASAPALATLEAGLATPVAVAEATSAGPPAGAVRLCEFTTHRDELRAAAGWIRTTIADSAGTLHFRDFAVIARDLEPFADLVAEVFAEYEIPYFLDRRRPLRSHPLARLLPALLEAVRTDFDAPVMVRLLRTRLLPLDADQAEQLENVLVGECVRGLDAWRQPRWELEAAGRLVEAFAPQRAAIVAALQPLIELFADEESRLTPLPSRSPRATRRGKEGLREGQDPHLKNAPSASQQPAPPTAPGEAWARALHEVLERLGIRRRLADWINAARREQRWETAETHRLAWTTVCETLDDLHTVLGDMPVSAEEVAAVLESALGDLTLGLAPPTVDQVLVSAIERSRHPDIRHAWVFAFNEGLFPARPPDDLLLSTEQREMLRDAGLPAPAARREDVLAERLLAYIALTRPSQSLTVSFAAVGDNGDELLPSPLVTELMRALPSLTAGRPAGSPPPTCLTELARGYLETRGDALHARYRRLCREVEAAPSLAGRLAWLLRGTAYHNTPPPIGNYRRVSDAVVWDASPSEIETYLQCPFKHFARYGLRLDPFRGPLPVRWDLGSLAHEILADVTRRAMGAPGGVRRVPDARWQEWLEESVRDRWARRPADLPQRRPDLVFLGGVLVGFLRDVVAVHAERWRRGRFEPIACEQRFAGDGAPDALPGVELPLADGGRVRVHGQIDRIDRAADGEQAALLVYDYKSGPPESVKQVFLTGNRLQLFLYLLAARQTLARQPDTRAAGVLLAPLYPDMTSLDSRYVIEAREPEQTMYLYRPRGLIEASVAPWLDPKLGTTSSPVAQLRLKKDGDFYKHSDVAAAEDIAARIDLAAQTVLHAAAGIDRGAIDVAPLLEAKTLACRNCEFQALCRYDPAFNRPRRAETTLPRLADDEGGDE
ncbi:MAG: PD-(D/E)XK nuclease family protein [Planctomycetota bacterium]